MAKNSLTDLRHRVPDLPPPNAFRMKVSDKGTPPEQGRTDKDDADELAKLIIPKKIVQNKFAKMANSMEYMKNAKNNANNKAINGDAAAAVRPKLMKNPNKRPEIVMSKGNVTTYDNGVVIEEL